MPGRQGAGDLAQDRALARVGRRAHQRALALADRTDQIEDAPGQLVPIAAELQALIGIDRGALVERNLSALAVDRPVVDRLDLEQGEVALVLLGRADLAPDGIARAQVEAADLRRRDVDVVAARQVVGVRSAEESEAVGQDLQHSRAGQAAAAIALRAQDGQDQLGTAQRLGIVDRQLAREADQVGRALLFDVGEVHRWVRWWVGVADVGRGSPVRGAGRTEAPALARRWPPISPANTGRIAPGWKLSRIMESVRVRVCVTGVVQGVFFRASTQAQARALGVTGWVRNRADGAVELEAQGPAGAVDALIAWCRGGPPVARVTGVEVEVAQPIDGERTFEVRR